MESWDINKPRKLQFDVSIDGIDPNRLTGQLQITCNENTLVFPVTINGKKMSATISPIQSVLKENIPPGVKIDCSLVVLGEGYYWNPWSDIFESSTSMGVTHVDVKASLKEKELLDEDKDLYDEFNIPDPDSKGSKGFDNQASKKSPPQHNTQQTDPENEFDELRAPVNPMSATGTLPKTYFSLTESQKKKIMVEEVNAVKKGISLSETNKNDNITALRYRTKVREKLMELYNEAQNDKAKKTEKKSIKPLTESKKVVLNDHPEVKGVDRSNVTEQDVINLLCSYGMTREGTQQRMIESASGGNKSTPWAAIYSTIENMLKPNNPQINQFEDQIKFMASKSVLEGHISSQVDNSKPSLLDLIKK